jgi:hypothetical protein
VFEWAAAQCRDEVQASEEHMAPRTAPTQKPVRRDLESNHDKDSEKTTAFAYLRTSSMANVGDDKDSQQRQITAIIIYAKRARIDHNRQLLR